ncbi:discoidin domain-containing protein [Lysinibacillus fusiformis]|uniref:discoidin domain-containing protein n=1 Tax=Lysinibacillus fusiformis TaxID=28031 RepID=UPI003CE89DE7
MAIINDVLISPESGWERYDLEPPFVNLVGAWSSTNSRPENFTGGSIRFTTVFSSSLTFDFYGEGLRLIVERNQAYDNGEIEIDGIKSDFSCYENISTYKGKVLVFEKTGLGRKKHTVTIKKKTNDIKPFNVDSVDIMNTNSRLVIENQTTDTHYSLSDNTLIHLPDNTTESIIEHGIEKDRYIQLDVPFDKHRYFNITPVDGTSGKVFTHDVGVINTLCIKEIVKNKDFEPVYTWHSTNMTANNTPSPLIASARGENSTTYGAWKAFNGTATDVYDCWISGSEGVNSWVQIKLDKAYQMTAVKITPRNGTDYNASSPQHFNILGSNNGTDFDTLLQPRSQTWTANTPKQFALNTTKEYSIYRIEVLSTNGSLNVAIGDIIFGYKREVN